MTKRSLFIGVFIALILGSAWFSLPSYLRKALIYQKPGIGDYKLFHNRKVQKGTAVPWHLHSRYNSLKPGKDSEDYFNQFGTVAYLVVQHDSILFEEYFDGYSDTTLSGSFSMAKSVISLLVGCLLDEGRIQDLRDPLVKYLPQLKPGMEKIRILDLLTMSSGLDWDEAYSSATSVTTQAYYGRDLEKLVSRLKLKEEPGKRFNYQSCDTQLLALLIRQLSGKTVSEYASEKLWKPLGAENDALWSLDDAEGLEKAYCCFNSSARDFARIGLMVLDSGQFNGRQLISKEYIATATSPASWLKDEDGNACTRYGYQVWMLNYRGMKINYARGILGQYIFIIPSLDAVVVRLGHKRSEVRRQGIPEDIFKYLDAAFEILR